MRKTFFPLLMLVLFGLVGCQVEADMSKDRADADSDPTASDSDSDPVLTRLFWQDRETMTIRWVDVLAGETVRFGTPGSVTGFPEFDPEKISLVQMKAIDGLLLVGVRDDENGEHHSGWLAIETGVREEPHGNHSHWHYESDPKVIASKLDTTQGNPAHLYIYGEEFYLANDRSNGYTRLSATDIRENGADAGQFYPGGGNHITLAAVDGVVGYSSWIDGGGPNAGRVDVTPLTTDGEPEIAYQITLPSANIHGAATADNKVFFAPKAGLAWIEADLEADDDPESVTVHEIDLGTNAGDDTPRRTGAFTVDRNWLAFTTGTGDSTMLGLIDAEKLEPTTDEQESKPQPIMVDLGADEDHKATTPVIFRAGRKRCAAVFLDYEEPESDEELVIVDLDPNRDWDRSDAKVLKRITVGNSSLQGHSGHHAVAIEPGRDFVFVINPGDSTVVPIDLKTWEPGEPLTIEGRSDSLTAVGEQEG